MDMQSCQLAIVAKLWEVPALYNLLASGRSIWEELARYLGVDPARSKPVLKRAAYSVCYGMGVAKLHKLLANGTDGNPGLGEEAARRFLQHLLIATLLKERKRVAAWAEMAGGLEDAWGNWIPVNAENPPHAVMARQAQSWEVRIMMAILPHAQNNPDIRIPLWLHEGVYIHSTDTSKEAAQVDRLQRALNRRAEELDIPTRAEVERLS